MDFTEVLSVKVDEVTKPPMAPVGHYIWKPTKYELDEFTSAKDGTEYKAVNIQVEAVQACSDVDQDILKEYGGVKLVRNRVSFMWADSDDEEARARADRTKWQMKLFLTEHCGLEDDDKTLGQLLDEAMGSCTFLGEIKPRKDKNDPTILYAEIARTAPVTEAPA